MKKQPEALFRAPNRPTMFEGKIKKGSHAVRGYLSHVGRIAFDMKKQEAKRLAAKYGLLIKELSDADTVEYLARGPDASEAYLQRRLKGLETAVW